MLKPKDQTRVTSNRQRKHTIQKMWTDLAWEGCPVQRLYKVCVHLVGTQNDGGHCLLVLQGRGGQKRESGQRDVVLDTGQAALIVAIWTQAAQKTERNTQGEGHRRQLKRFQINTLNARSWSTVLETCRGAWRLTWTPERRPRCRWRGRAPSGWRCVPTLRGSGRAWPFQKLC